MDFWRKYMWIWIPAGVLLASLVICLIFVLINKYIISKDHSKRFFEPPNTTEHFVRNNLYQQNKQEDVVPPLPPRTQFSTSSSYESIVDPPEYLQVEEEETQCPPPLRKSAESCHSVDGSTEDYDDIGEEDDCQDGEDYDDVG